MGATRVTGLPEPITSLIGREPELAELARLLAAPAVRLLTLVGPGGVGKTRLALRAASMAERHFDDGVCFVDLSPVNDPASIAAAVAQALDCEIDPHRPLIDSLIDEIAPQHLLLVLDNFEHLLPAAPFVSFLLVSCPTLVVLATSRERLGLYGEQLFPVEPLLLPDLTGPLTVEQIGSSPAVRLFVERARAVRPTFALSEANAGDVAAVCALLDGLPLAIELAAARSAVLSPKALRARLAAATPGTRDLLRVGGHGLPERHQTIDGTIAWSYTQLTPDEQFLLCRLSVFAGSFSLEAAEAVARPRDEVRNGSAPPFPSVLDMLTSLLDKHLIRIVSGPDDEPRFGMLETIRQFCQEQLQQHGEEAAARWAQARYVLSLVERAEPDLAAGRFSTWMPLLDAEAANIRAALIWCLEQGAIGCEMALRICKGAWNYWKASGAWVEHRDRLQRLIALGCDTNPALLAEMLLLYGHILLQGNPIEAQRHYERGLELYRLLGDRRGEARALSGLGIASSDMGAHEQALESLRAARELFESLNDSAGIALVEHYLGFVAMKQGELATAAKRIGAALSQWRALGRGDSAIFALIDLARIGRMQGHLKPAQVLLERAQEENATVGSKEVAGYIVLELGQIALLSNDRAGALSHFIEALRLLRQGGFQDYFTAAAIEGIAHVACLEGDAASAIRLIAAATAWRQSTRIVATEADQQQIQGILESAKRSVGEEAFNSHWLIGETLSLDDAIAIAFSIVVAPPAEQKAAEPTTLPEDLRRLSPREREVLCLIASGLKDREIAAELGISVRTVTTIVGHILNKLVNHGQNRAAAAAYATAHRLCPPPSLG
ncbi:MAG TPA: tetratricopeptide repeat protein [Thermomicrobiales bacterium]